MKPNIVIYNSLVDAPQLEDAVRSLSDEELRNVRGALARGDINSWPADLVHGVCIVESSERFMNNGIDYRDRDHGSEVSQ